MARTTPTDVQNILAGNYNGTTDLVQFIDAATVVVDEVSTCASDRGNALGTTVLELIERWLSAHFYLSSDPLYSSKRTERAAAVFQGRNQSTSNSLETTDYGRRAMMLDPSGCLASVGESRNLQLIWLGKAPSDQIAVQDRD